MAVQHIAVELDVVADVKGGVRVDLGRLAAVVQRCGSRGVYYRAAVLAEARTGLQLGGAAEQAADVGAVGRVEEVVASERAVDQDVAAGQLRRGAVEVVLLGQVAVVGPDRALLFVLHAAEQAEAAIGRGPAIGDADAEAVAAAFRSAAAADVDHRAVQLLLKDDVDHAGDGVRAVQRGLAAGQDFDAVDQVDQDAADVVERIAAVVQRRIARHRTAVDQVLHVARRQAEQADGLGALGERGRGLLALNATRGKGALLQHVGDRGEATRVDVLGADDHHRSGGLDFGLRDQRTGHGDAVEFLGLILGQRGAGSRQNDSGEHGGREAVPLETGGFTGRHLANPLCVD